MGIKFIQDFNIHTIKVHVMNCEENKVTIGFEELNWQHSMRRDLTIKSSIPVFWHQLKVNDITHL